MLSKINKSWVNESREATEERYNNTKLGYVVVIGGGFVSAAFVALLTYNIHIHIFLTRANVQQKSRAPFGVLADSHVCHQNRSDMMNYTQFLLGSMRAIISRC